LRLSAFARALLHQSRSGVLLLQQATKLGNFSRINASV
jgi:hypothetical protein